MLLVCKVGYAPRLVRLPLHHPARHVVTLPELVREALPLFVEEDGAHAAKDLGAEREPGGVGVLAVDEGRRVDLDLV